MIGGSVYSRIDFETDESGGLAQRSVVSGPNGSAVFETGSGTVLHRVPARASSAELPDMRGRSLFERVNVDELKRKMSGLDYDAVYKEGAGCDRVVCFIAPSSLLPKSSGNDRVSAYKIMFDASNGMMAGSETVEAKDDGTILTTTVTKYYQEVDGVTVPAGEMLVVHHDIPGRIEFDSSAYPRILSIDDLPTVSEKDFKDMQIAGQAYEVPEAVLGDPSDPDFSETVLTVYEAVSTNCLSDSMFKIGGME
jgi:hypothetical protein